MTFTLQLVVAALAAFPLLAVGNGIHKAPTHSQEVCKTFFGRSSVRHVQTATHRKTVTLHPISVSFKVPTKTVTPRPKIKTSTATATATITEPQQTDTFSSTSTEIVSVTVSAVETITNTVVESDTVTITSTSSVPTPPGFQFPLTTSSTIEKRNNRHSYKAPPRKHKNSGFECSLPKGHGKGGRPSWYPAHYPSKVICDVLVEVVSTRTIVKTAHRTVTRRAPRPTITKTNVITTTSTSTLIDASTTLTFTEVKSVTSTATSTSTEIDTVTNTDTVTVPGPTEYAACSPQNLVGTANGYGIGTVSEAGSPNAVPAGSSLDCCVFCQQTPGCGGAFYFDGECLYIPLDDGCPATQPFFEYNPDTSVPPGTGFIISAGNPVCGPVVLGPTLG
ncbi:MAG: pre-mRNA-splicing factor cwc22 [Chaenotheca gracillima]|nr:MAG: pre-mRNA-splicing factor cwc22 [Chaenotheca gracillima]